MEDRRQRRFIFEAAFLKEKIFKKTLLCFEFMKKKIKFLDFIIFIFD